MCEGGSGLSFQSPGREEGRGEHGRSVGRSVGGIGSHPSFLSLLASSPSPSDRNERYFIPDFFLRPLISLSPSSSSSSCGGGPCVVVVETPPSQTPSLPPQKPAKSANLLHHHRRGFPFSGARFFYPSFSPAWTWKRSGKVDRTIGLKFVGLLFFRA